MEAFEGDPENRWDGEINVMGHKWEYIIIVDSYKK